MTVENLKKRCNLNPIVLIFNNPHNITESLREANYFYNVQRSIQAGYRAGTFEARHLIKSVGIQ
jgi:hypothetical protein